MTALCESAAEVDFFKNDDMNSTSDREEQADLDRFNVHNIDELKEAIRQEEEIDPGEDNYFLGALYGRFHLLNDDRFNAHNIDELKEAIRQEEEIDPGEDNYFLDALYERFDRLKEEAIVERIKDLNIDQLKEILEQDCKRDSEDDGILQYRIECRIEDEKAKLNAKVDNVSWADMCHSVENPHHSEKECFVIDPLLRRSETMMIHAPRGTGKTWFCLALARAVALGQPFLKWPTQVGRVLYLEGEMSSNGFAERLYQIAASSEREILGKQVDLVRAKSTRLPFDLADKKCRLELRKFLFEAGHYPSPQVDLVILDSLSTLAPRLDENKTDHWEPIEAWLAELKEEGIVSQLKTG